MSARGLAGFALLLTPTGCGPGTDFRDRSMVEIIAMPDRFDGQRMSLHGYYGENIVGPFSFLTEEHAAMLDSSNAVRLGNTVDGDPFASVPGCRPGHLVVFGRFAGLDVGGMGPTDVERAVTVDLGEHDDGGTCYEATIDR